MNRLLFATVCASLFVAASSTSYAASVYFKFDGNYNDSSGSGYSITGGIASHSFSSDTPSNGSSDYSLQTPSSAYLTTNFYTPNYLAPNTAYTTEFFFKSDVSSSGIYYMLSTFNTTHNVGWNITLYYGKVRISYLNAVIAESSELYNDDQWHHFAFTHTDDHTVSLYMDYEFVASTANVNSNFISTQQKSLMIGGSNGGTGLDGYIDELRISDGVLEATEFLGHPSTAVPEPASLILLLAGCAGLIRRLRK